MCMSAEKIRLFKSKIKVMLIIFFDVHEIVHLKFLPQGQTINQATGPKHLQRHLVTFDAFSMGEKKIIVGDKIMAASS